MSVSKSGVWRFASVEEEVRSDLRSVEVEEDGLEVDVGELHDVLSG